MNRNLPHAAQVIRTVMAAGGSAPVTAAAHALDGERLLVDPEKSYGIVLHRTAAGGWSRGPRQLTELERQARAWDLSCRRARVVAASTRGTSAATRTSRASTRTVTRCASHSWSPIGTSGRGGARTSASRTTANGSCPTR
ncbi:hypothetical protein ACIP79_06800 [Streptomyces sp. NPDC088747]|uniref:hypothetical protein n=1 Tax=Streptomyces sp. NPDC088747 TaxID=3365886 RepID=UPI0038163E91